jgi:hypothetical protein
LLLPQVPPSRAFLVSGQRNKGFSPQGFYGPMNLNRFSLFSYTQICSNRRTSLTQVVHTALWRAILCGSLWQTDALRSACERLCRCRYRAGRPLRGATCGGEKAGDNRFEVGGKFAQRKIVASYKAGSYIKTKVHIDINHWGGLPRMCMAQHGSKGGDMCVAQHLGDVGRQTAGRGPSIAIICRLHGRQ